MARASYRFGIHWIAVNDEPEELEVETIAELISVMLLADLFGKHTHDVARAIVRERRRMGA